MESWLDTIRKSPQLNSLDIVSDTGLLYPPFCVKIQSLVVTARAASLNVIVFETYRSEPRQLLLFKQGRTKIKTNGMHHYGVAADLVFLLNGQPAWPSAGDPRWKELADIGRKLGLYWGGDFKGLVDCPHWQYVAATVAAQNPIRAGKYPA